MSGQPSASSGESEMEFPKIEGLEKLEGSHVKVGSNIMMKGRPSTVTKVSFAKPGKHGEHSSGHAAVKLTFTPIRSRQVQHSGKGHAEK